MTVKKESLEKITYSQILKLNRGSRWKADKVVEYYTSRNSLLGVRSRITVPGDIDYIVNHLEIEDLKYKATHFEPPIGRRELIAWGIAILFGVLNLTTWYFS